MDSSFEEDYEDLADILENRSLIRMRLLPKTIPLDYLTDEETRKRFRFCKQSICDLMTMLTEKTNLINQIEKSKTSSVSLLLQVLITLRFLATGNFQISNGDLHNVSQPCVSKIVKRVTRAIASLRPLLIKYPSHAEAIQKRNEFQALGNFPGVVGCIDCTHIAITSPGGNNAELFRNRKGYFSINVQAVCDANLQFLNCVARWPGSVHDSRIFDSCLLKAQLENNEVPGILLGDGGYRSLPYLFTPFDQPNTPGERNYNKQQIKIRNSVERSFGLLKRRFYCLGSKLRTKLFTSLPIIVACFVLHNFAIMRNEEFLEESPEENPPDPEIPAANINYEARSTASGLATRRTLVNTHFA